MLGAEDGRTGSQARRERRAMFGDNEILASAYTYSVLIKQGDALFTTLAVGEVLSVFPDRQLFVENASFAVTGLSSGFCLPDSLGSSNWRRCADSRCWPSHRHSRRCEVAYSIDRVSGLDCY